MSRLNHQEVPGLIASLRPGDRILIDRINERARIVHEFVKSDHVFVYTKGTTPESIRTWYRYTVLGRALLKTPRLYTDIS